MAVNNPVKLLLSFTNHTILSATPPREGGDAFFRADRPTPRLPSGASCARGSDHYKLIVVLASSLSYNAEWGVHFVSPSAHSAWDDLCIL